MSRELPKRFPDNLHVVDPLAHIWRSGQPEAEDVPVLVRLGFRSVLNLRRLYSGRSIFDGTDIREYRIKLFIPSEAEMVEALRIILTAEKPLLIHCRHGSDRTGAVAVGYRIVFNRWTLEDALNEFYNPDYGYHPWLYWSLPRKLRRYDWGRIAAAVHAPGTPPGVS